MNREEVVKSVFQELGVDVCGIASIDRFENAPKGFHPKDVYEDCESVIIFGKKMPLGSMLVSPRLIYLESMQHLLAELDSIAFHGSIGLEKLGAIAVPIPSDSPYEYWDEARKEGRGLLSLKHAAEFSGLGKIGKNTLLLNRKYGNTLMLGCVLTNLTLIPNELDTKNLCLPKCRICIDECPTNALDGVTIDQKRCREIVYGTNEKGFSVCNCNKCRVLCPIRFGARLRSN